VANINRRNALKWFATTAGVLAFTSKAMAKECSSCKGSGTGPFDCSRAKFKVGWFPYNDLSINV